MKKQATKLALNKITVNELSSNHSVRGGGTSYPCKVFWTVLLGCTSDITLYEACSAAKQEA